MNGTLRALLITAIVILVIMGVYQIFFKPSESVPETAIIPINTYYGEDILAFLNQK
jgi:hypothetical protein